MWPRPDQDEVHTLARATAFYVSLFTDALDDAVPGWATVSVHEYLPADETARAEITAALWWVFSALTSSRALQEVLRWF